MELSLVRFKLTDAYTIGKLLVDGLDFNASADVDPAAPRIRIYTLEDAIREVEGVPVEEWKIPGVTAIPRGRYELKLQSSPSHNGQPMPYLRRVPGFTCIMIHPGNWPSDTEGCILVGYAWGGAGFVGDSRAAFKDLFSRLVPAFAAGRVYLSVG